MQNIWFVALFLCFALPLKAQFVNPDTIQLSGVVLDADSLTALPNVHIVSHRNRGTLTDVDGQFSLKINTSDTLKFTYLGYKPYIYVVPDTLFLKHYIAGIVLRRDTIMLSEVIILPFMNRAQFKQSFLNNQPDLETQNATRNLNIMSLQSRQASQWPSSQMMIDVQLKKMSTDVEYRGMIGPDEQLNIIGLAALLIYYSHQQLTKEEKNQRIKAELQQYLRENYKK
jgi:hypothetical protein